jgi:hypothetical protein
MSMVTKSSKKRLSGGRKENGMSQSFYIPRKRVNSKEEVPLSDELLYSSVDIDGTSIAGGVESGSEVMFLPRKMLSELNLPRRAPATSMGSFRIVSKSELEELLKDPVNRKKAIEALTVNHCLESLSCLLKIFDWEAEMDEEEKQALQDFILAEYVNLGSANEVCLPETIRTGLDDGQSTLLDVKAHLLNDLRFNTILTSAVAL